MVSWLNIKSVNLVYMTNCHGKHQSTETSVNPGFCQGELDERALAVGVTA